MLRETACAVIRSQPPIQLEFSFRMIRSKCGVNMNEWIHLPCVSGSGWCWWCNDEQDHFLAHFGPLSSRWASFKGCNYPEYWCWCVHPFRTTVDHLLMVNGTCHKAQICEFTVLHRPPWWDGDSHHKCAAKNMQQRADFNRDEHLWGWVQPLNGPNKVAVLYNRNNKELLSWVTMVLRERREQDRASPTVTWALQH